MKKLFYLVLVLILISCQSSKVFEYSDKDIENGREAVLEMINQSSLAATNVLLTQDILTTFSGQLIGTDGAIITNHLDEIPGLKRELNQYLDEGSLLVASLIEKLHLFISNTLIELVYVEDPFNLINGNEFAVTTFFAQEATDNIESFLLQEIKSSEGKKSLDSWAKVQSTYNSYAYAYPLLFPSHSFELISVEIEKVITFAILRQFFGAMREQEALIRTLAPTYDDSLLTIFASR